MFGITTFLFALAIIALVLQTTLFQKANLISNSYIIYSYVWATITCVTVRDTFMSFSCPVPLTVAQHILCDIICAWRTVVIWNRDKHIITILVVFIFGTIGTYKKSLRIDILCLYRTIDCSYRRICPCNWLRPRPKSILQRSLASDIWKA